MSLIDLEISCFYFSIFEFFPSEKAFLTEKIIPVIKNVINAESVYLKFLCLFANERKSFCKVLRLFVIPLSFFIYDSIFNLKFLIIFSNSTFLEIKQFLTLKFKSIIILYKPKLITKL